MSFLLRTAHSSARVRVLCVSIVFLSLCVGGLHGPLPSKVDASTPPGIFSRLIFIRDLQSLLSVQESIALSAYRRGRFLDARTQADAILQAHPHSMVGHFVKAYVLRHAEGELIRSLRHLRRALALYKKQVNRIPGFTHHVMIVELFSSLRQLGREKECLKLIAYHDRVYSKIKLEDIRPWVLMKLHRYKEARALALRFLKQKKHIMSSLNALCAIHFEQNKRKESLAYCQKAYKEDGKRKNQTNRSVHLINLAEAHLSLLHLSEAETFALRATKHFHRFLHSTPWEFLVGLYLDQGRYNDAWNALRKSHNWYMLQAPKLSESIYAGNQMTKSVFFLSMGQPNVALSFLERIRDRPDRRGHMSADTRQFVVGERLLRRQARRMLIEKMREKAATEGFFTRVGVWFKVQWHHFLAWRDGSSARRTLADTAFLQRNLAPYRSGSFSMPNSAIPFWMIGDIIPLIGPAVIREAIEDIRGHEVKQTRRVLPFLTALEAETAYHQGDTARASVLLRAALTRLPLRLAPLRGRLLTLQGALARDKGSFTVMQQAFARVLRKNGAPFRDLQIALPLSALQTHDHSTREIAVMLQRSPRFELHYKGFRLQLRHAKGMMQASLVDPGGSVLHRFTLTKKSKEKQAEYIKRFVVAFQNDLFSPHFRLSRKQIFSLDDTLLRSGAGPAPIKIFERPKPPTPPRKRRKRRKRR